MSLLIPTKPNQNQPSHPPQHHTGAKEATAVAKALQSNTTLQEFHASGHDIGTAGAEAFGHALAANSTLQRLCIGHDKFGDAALRALVESGLMHNKGLLKWDLELKGLSPASGVYIGRGMVLCVVFTLPCQHLPYCPLLLLLPVLQVHPTLQELALSRNALGDAGVQALADGYAKRDVSAALTTLDLSDNDVRTANKALPNPRARPLNTSECTTDLPRWTHHAWQDAGGRQAASPQTVKQCAPDIWCNTNWAARGVAGHWERGAGAVAQQLRPWRALCNRASVRRAAPSTSRTNTDTLVLHRETLSGGGLALHTLAANGNAELGGHLGPALAALSTGAPKLQVLQLECVGLSDALAAKLGEYFSPVHSTQPLMTPHEHSTHTHRRLRAG